MRIAEIGVGYGGQCRVVCTAWPILSYDLFDIPEVLALSRRFLGAVDLDLTSIRFVDGRNPGTGDYDLVVSNYAFSELQRNVQEAYLERVVLGSRRGYVTYNHIAPEEWGSLSAQEFADRVPGARIVPERPLTHADNVIVLWGTLD
jgi:hypothetical protein